MDAIAIKWHHDGSVDIITGIADTVPTHVVVEAAQRDMATPQSYRYAKPTGCSFLRETDPIRAMIASARL
jgi:hypothetical protein